MSIFGLLGLGWAGDKFDKRRVASTGTGLREDKIHSGLSQKQLLENAPDTEKGQFRVPPILE